MKRICLSVLLAILVGNVSAELRVEVSETVELTSILATLAGYEEYNQEYGTSYKQDVLEWFEPYRAHTSVAYFSTLRSRNNIMYDAVASMGIHLYIEGGNVKMQENTTLMDSRSQSVDRNELVQHLTRFYKDSHFHDFFEKHQSLYEATLNQYREAVLPYVSEEWYPRFYGTASKGNFVVVLAFNNGYNAYGPKRQTDDGTREAFSVIGIFGGIDFSRNGTDQASTIIHEFNHSYVNYLLEESQSNQDLLKESGEWLYHLTAWTMNDQAYTEWMTVINETIVRAGEVMYAFDNNYTADQIENLVKYQISRGFLWTPEIVEQLRIYSQNRDKYPSLADFYPELINCINSYVEKEKERLDRCIGLPKAETIKLTENKINYIFKSNRDTPTTLTLTGAENINNRPMVIPSSANGYPVKYIGEKAFRDNHSLTKVVIPEGVESIKDDAFSWSSLDEISLPSTLKSIGFSSLALCNGLHQLHIPASVTNLDYQCIANNSITTLTVDKDNPVFDSRDNCNAIIETATNTLLHATLTTEIPKSVTALGTEAFNTLQRMTSVTIPSWITSVGSRAFQYCTGLQTIYCEIEKPFPISNETFIWVTDNATLYVPYGTKSLYQATEGWKLFTNIVEMSQSAIREIKRPTITSDAVYGLNGTRMNSPKKGLIIRNGQKLIWK